MAAFLRTRAAAGNEESSPARSLKKGDACRDAAIYRLAAGMASSAMPADSPPPDRQ